MLLTEEWYLPDKYIHAVRNVLGRIDFNPRSSEEANQTIQAALFYQDEEYSLGQNWMGPLFLMFPLPAQNLTYFIDKFISEWFLGRVDQAILLLPSDTSSRWFQCLISKVDALCFVKGKIGFYSPFFRCTQNRHGSIFYYVGPNVEDFMREFSVFGYTLCPPL